MSLGSINTNTPAMIALEALNMTNSALAATEKQVSTGYRVADAVDDGAAFAVAQNVRSDVATLTSVNQQLGGASGLLGTTTKALTDVSNAMISAKTVLAKLADSSISTSERSQYQTQYNTYMNQVTGFFLGATYNGKSLIGNVAGQTAATGAVSVIQDERGDQYAIARFSGGTFLTGAVLSTSASFTSTQAASYLQSAGATPGVGSTFAYFFNQINTQLNYYGFATDYVNQQVSYNSDKIDSLNTGLGALIDANLTQESAQLQALQVRQQLGTQSLSIANQSPQSLLTLFK
jgi:flagellin